jgi:demethylmenaquinone methyltransferase/2-methoxy-6-polyprenyl-1,4-benzoquinol methylase
MNRKETPLGVRIFDKIADKYEFTAKFISFGILPYWLSRLVKTLPERGDRVLDLACGTGILFPKLVKRFNKVYGLDYSLPMLKMAQKKGLENVYLVRGDALRLPFKNEIFDSVVVSFGLRHFPDIEKTLDEINRVLKKGGSLHILEVGIPRNPILKKLYMSFLKYVVLPLGKLRAKENVYHHLFGSIMEFPHYEKLIEKLHEKGFAEGNFKPLMFGIAVIYTARKI